MRHSIGLRRATLTGAMLVAIALSATACVYIPDSSTGEARSTLATLAGTSARVVVEQTRSSIAVPVSCTVRVNWDDAEPDAATYIALVEGLAPALRGTAVGACADPTVRTPSTTLSVASSALTDEAYDWKALATYIATTRPALTHVDGGDEGDPVGTSFHIEVPRVAALEALLQASQRIRQDPEARDLPGGAVWWVKSCSPSELGQQYCSDHIEVRAPRRLDAAPQALLDELARIEHDILGPGRGFEGTIDLTDPARPLLDLDIYVDAWANLNDAAAKPLIPGSPVEEAANAVAAALAASGLDYSANVRSRGTNLVDVHTPMPAASASPDAGQLPR